MEQIKKPPTLALIACWCVRIPLEVDNIKFVL